MKQNIKYIYLTAALLIGFFLFTGGILSPPHWGPKAPTINSFTITSEEPTIYQRVEFVANVTANSSDQGAGQHCEDKYEGIMQLRVSIKILKDDVVVIEDRMKITSHHGRKSGIYTFSTSFNSADDYTAIITATSSEFGDIKSTTRSIEFTVSARVEQLMPGTYNLAIFYVKCSRSSEAYERTKNLDGNYFTIDEAFNATLAANIAFDESTVEKYPCLLSTNYSYNLSGRVTIVKEGDQLQMKIYYNDQIYVPFLFDYDEKTIWLKYVDDDNNEYQWTFRKP